MNEEQAAELIRTLLAIKGALIALASMVAGAMAYKVVHDWHSK